MAPCWAVGGRYQPWLLIKARLPHAELISRMRRRFWAVAMILMVDSDLRSPAQRMVTAWSRWSKLGHENVTRGFIVMTFRGIVLASIAVWAPHNDHGRRS